MAKKNGMYLLMNLQPNGMCKILDTSDGAVDNVSLYQLSKMLNNSEDKKIYGLVPLNKAINIPADKKIAQLNIAIDIMGMVKGWFYFYRQQGYVKAKEYAYAQFGYRLDETRMTPEEQKQKLQELIALNEGKPVWF